MNGLVHGLRNSLSVSGTQLGEHKVKGGNKVYSLSVKSGPDFQSLISRSTGMHFSARQIGSGIAPAYRGEGSERQFEYRNVWKSQVLDIFPDG